MVLFFGLLLGKIWLFGRVEVLPKLDVRGHFSKPKLISFCRNCRAAQKDPKNHDNWGTISGRENWFQAHLNQNSHPFFWFIIHLLQSHTIFPEHPFVSSRFSWIVLQADTVDGSEIPNNHLRCMIKNCKSCDKLPTSTGACRISSILTVTPSTRFSHTGATSNFGRSCSMGSACDFTPQNWWLKAQQYCWWFRNPPRLVTPIYRYLHGF